MAYLVERMEKCLRAWEDFWFLVKVVNDIAMAKRQPPPYPSQGPMLHAASFRKKILRGRQEPIQLEYFLAPEHPHFNNRCLPGLALPLSQWCSNSRRVYHIKEDLQAILGATSLEGITWNDVVLPFLSYALKLDQPVTDADGDSFDFVMVTSFTMIRGDGSHDRAIDLRFLTRKCDQYEPMSEANKSNIHRRMHQGQYDHVRDLVSQFLKKTDSCVGSFVQFSGEYLTLEVMSTAQQVYGLCREDMLGKLSEEIAVPCWETLIRIVVGMCLYLKTLPSQSPHRSEWRPVPRSGLPDPRAISNEAQVCTISSCYALTTEERVVLGLQGTRAERAAYELSCHFRQGHWRRAPGSGNDPNAPKTVHVRPCLVRKDRLRDGELPGGSGAIVGSTTTAT